MKKFNYTLAIFMQPAQLLGTPSFSFRQWSTEDLTRFVSLLQPKWETTTSFFKIFANVTNLLAEQEEEILSIPKGDNLLAEIPAEPTNPLFYFQRERWLENHNRQEFLRHLSGTDVRELILPRGSLTRLPPEIGLLTHLETLVILNNPLRTISPQIGQLTRLKKLMICFTSLRFLCPEIQNLSNLEYVDVSRNQLEHIDPLAHLPNLIQLDAKMNRIKRLPPEVHWDRLQILTLRKNPVTDSAGTTQLPTHQLACRGLNNLNFF